MLIKCANVLLLDIKLSITLASRLPILNVDSISAVLHGFIQQCEHMKYSLTPWNRLNGGVKRRKSLNPEHRIDSNGHREA